MRFIDFTKKELLYFIKNKYNLNDNNILLEIIKDEYNLIEKFINNNKFLISINKIDNDHKFLKNLNKKCQSKFIIKNLNDELNNLNENYLISWNNNNIIIKSDNIGNFFKRINILIYMIEFLNKKNVILKIYLLLTKLKKKLPINNEIINVQHINSGVSYMHNYILIWRFEEFEKLIFHELIHYFNLDCKKQIIINKIKIKGFDSQNEAITDIWGIIYYIIYLSLNMNINIKLILEIELKFIQNQALLINNYFNLNEWKNKPNKIIYQESSAFSYYILKYLMLEYIINNINTKEELYNLINNYNLFIDKILSNGIKLISYKKLNSCRMTLLQLF